MALSQEGRTIVSSTFPHGLAHAAGLLPLIAQACDEIGWKPADLGHIYVSVGPGSFTGLRIGVTMAKTLAFVTGAKIVAVPSTRVLVENAAVDARHVVIVLDAKRGQIFTARYDRSPAGWAVGEEDHLDTLAAMLERSPRPVCLIGEGIPFHQQSIPASDDGVVIAAVDRWQGQAAIVANLGWTMACKGEFTDPLSLAPIYIRRPEAEEKADAAMKLPQATSP